MVDTHVLGGRSNYVCYQQGVRGNQVVKLQVKIRKGVYTNTIEAGMIITANTVHSQNKMYKSSEFIFQIIINFDNK